MAVGDQVGIVTTIAGGAIYNFIPAVGVECIVTRAFTNKWQNVTPNQCYKMYVRLFYVAVTSIMANSDSNPSFFNRMRLLITHDVYLRLENKDGGGHPMGFTGIQIK